MLCFAACVAFALAFRGEVGGCGFQCHGRAVVVAVSAGQLLETILLRATGVIERALCVRATTTWVTIASQPRSIFARTEIMLPTVNIGPK